jgi:hypothetical protein
MLKNSLILATALGCSVLFTTGNAQETSPVEDNDSPKSSQIEQKALEA